MKALITGGAGYFGSILVDRLLAQSWECRVLDKNTYYGDNKVEIFKGDVRDLEFLSKACDGIDVVFHNVAQVPLAKDKKLFDTVNIDGTINVLKASVSKGVKKVIYTSSSAVYGIPSKNPVTEKMIPSPAEDYGKAKYIAEMKCLDYMSKGIDIIIIRPRTILGHGRLGIFQILFEWIRSGNNIPVLGKGDNIYQFVHADDLANLIVLSADSKVKSGIYNCGADVYGTMREALENLCDYAKSGSVVKSVPFSLATWGMKLSNTLGLSPLGAYHALMYGRSMYFDISKAKNELSWEPKYSNDMMFKESYEWYCSNRDEIIKNTKKGSHHQTKLNQGVLKAINWFL